MTFCAVIAPVRVLSPQTPLQQPVPNPVTDAAMPAGRDGRGKAARGKGKDPVACHAENDQERSALDGQADRHRTRDVLCERMSEMNHNRNVAEQQARFAQKSGSEYDRQLADAIRHIPRALHVRTASSYAYTR